MNLPKNKINIYYEHLNQLVPEGEIGQIGQLRNSKGELHRDYERPAVIDGDTQI